MAVTWPLHGRYRCVLSKDYVGLVKAFVDTGFIGNPIEWRAVEADPWQTTHPDGDDLVAIMAKERSHPIPSHPIPSQTGTTSWPSWQRSGHHSSCTRRVAPQELRERIEARPAALLPCCPAPLLTALLPR